MLALCYSSQGSHFGGGPSRFSALRCWLKPGRVPVTIWVSLTQPDPAAEGAQAKCSGAQHTYTGVLAPRELQQDEKPRLPLTAWGCLKHREISGTSVSLTTYPAAPPAPKAA